jgi:hypothetical protein
MVALSKVQWDGYRRWMEKDEAERMAAREQTRNGRLRRDSRKAEGAGTKSRHEGSRGAGTPTHTLAKHLPALGPEKRRACGLVFTWRAPTFALGAASIMTILPSLDTYSIMQ